MSAQPDFQQRSAQQAAARAVWVLQRRASVRASRAGQVALLTPRLASARRTSTSLSKAVGWTP